MGAARLAAQQDLFGKQNSVGKKTLEMYLLQCLNLAFCLAACCSANTLQLVPCWSARLLQNNGCAWSFLAQQRAQREITIVIQTNDIHCHDHCL